MMTLRPANERGHANHGWLDSWHSFSFADYYDPNHMGFRALRVINDDRIAGGGGFPPHPHRDMEIISYVAEGALEHRDSMGNGSVIRPGDVQRMRAGTGVTHSEYNPSPDAPMRLLQIWILPEARSLEPGYAQKNFARERHGALRLVASRDGREGSLDIAQDADLYASVLASGEQVRHRFAPGRHGWLQMVRGQLRANDQPLGEGDGLALSEVQTLDLQATDEAEFLLFDLV